MTTSITLTGDHDIEGFPLSDGDAMPETTSHRVQLSDLIFALELLLEPLPRVFVGGNHFIYYNRHNRRDHISPDVYVVLNVDRGEREAYFTWREGKFPDLVIEIVSPTNTDEELDGKRTLYARLGAREYYVYDPVQVMQPPLLGYYRLSDELVPMSPLPSGGLHSTVLQTQLRQEGRWLRVIDPRIGEPIPVPREQTTARRTAEAALERAERAWHAAEAARREAEQRAAQETQARLEAEERAAREAQALAETLAALQAAQAEIARLRREQSGG